MGGEILCMPSELSLLFQKQQKMNNKSQFLAWNNPSLTSEFMVLLPALADTSTAVEMLPALLDLPGLTTDMNLLAPLHQRLQPLASCAQVVQCSQAVPTLLQAFLLAVTKYADMALASQLALLVLERSDSLYQVPQYEAHVHRCVPPVNSHSLHPSSNYMAPALYWLQ
ncbi:hypothetical protein MC885_021338 [Smutsia gigantea]|nr:hypothetical protein MC885_021338 [Smutsia gigantea]